MPDAPLEPDEATFRAWVADATERLVEHLAGLPTTRAQVAWGGEALAAALRKEAPPEEASSLAGLLDEVFEQAASVTYNTAAPGYLAFVPGGGLPAAAVADLISSTLNRYTTVWLAAPGFVEIEQNALRWLCSLVDRGTGRWAEAGGLFLSGGSLANFTAVHTARAERLAGRPTDGVIYTSCEAHHSVLKAAHLAGFAPDDVRVLPVGPGFALEPAVLREAVREDSKAGKRPFLVVAHAGSTNTGALDPLPALAEVCEEEGLWLHVDAAYGGPFLLTERGRALLAGIERADSVTMDPHKGLFLPLGTGALLVRDRAALRRAHEVPGAYMPPMQDDPRHVDFCALGPELSREWRGLRVWLPLHVHGVAAFRRALEAKLDDAAHAEACLRRLPDVRVVAPARLSLVAYRWEPAGLDVAATDALNRMWLERANAKGRVFVTGTQLDAPFERTWVGRLCVLSFRTDRARVDMAVDDLAAAQRELAAERGLPSSRAPEPVG